MPTTPRIRKRAPKQKRIQNRALNLAATRAALTLAGGNRDKAAAILKISRVTLFRRMWAHLELFEEFPGTMGRPPLKKTVTPAP